jgi:hypothetical protein
MKFRMRSNNCQLSKHLVHLAKCKSVEARLDNPESQLAIESDSASVVDKIVAKSPASEGTTIYCGF